MNKEDFRKVIIVAITPITISLILNFINRSYYYDRWMEIYLPYIAIIISVFYSIYNFKIEMNYNLKRENYNRRIHIFKTNKCIYDEKLDMIDKICKYIGEVKKIEYKNIGSEIVIKYPEYRESENHIIDMEKSGDYKYIDARFGELQNDIISLTSFKNFLQEQRYVYMYYDEEEKKFATSLNEIIDKDELIDKLYVDLKKVSEEMQCLAFAPNAETNKEKYDDIYMLISIDIRYGIKRILKYNITIKSYLEIISTQNRENNIKEENSCKIKEQLKKMIKTIEEKENNHLKTLKDSLLFRKNSEKRV